MTETQNTTESVYQTHRDKILGSRSAQTDVHHPQGYYIDQIVDYAHTSIPEDEANRVRCGTFTSLKYICKFIAVKEDIPESKVYPALRYIGWNIRYHNMKCGKPDILTELGKHVKECMNTGHMSLVAFVMNDSNIFSDTSSALYRMRKDTIAITMKDAEYCSLKVSEMNLYNVLEGIDTLILNEPDYILMRDKRIVRAPMDIFHDAKDMLRWKCAGLEGILNDR